MKPLVRMITHAIGVMPLRSRVASMHLVADVGSVRGVARPVAADTARDVAILSSCSKISMTHTQNSDLTGCDDHMDEPQRVDTPLACARGPSVTASGGAGAMPACAAVAVEHWDVLFNAVIERLEAAARQGIDASDGPHAQAEIDRVRRIVLECVEALRQLNATARG
jgi:hypothetical protein